MNDVELVKSKIDIVTFISEYITLKKAGRNFKANCPFHHEKTPSFVVSPERQSWHCFGGCAEGGDAISFLQKWENIEFVEALKILAKRFGVPLSNFTPTEKTKIKDLLYEINHLASEFYHYLLLSHPTGKKALEYLKERNIKKETIDTFMLGYAPKSWNSLASYLQKKGYHIADIHNAGLVIRSDRGTYYDRFRGRLMFTLRDHRGNIIGFSGRVLPNLADKEEIKEAKYINTPETPIYIKGETLYGLDITKDAIKKEKAAVVVEGEFDFLASFQSGVPNVVAIKGSALTEAQTLLFKRYTENLLLALDSDFAGNEAAKRGIDIAEAAGLMVKVVRLEYGKDPAECVDKSPHLWKDSIAKASPIYDFIISSALSKYDKNTVEGKSRISANVMPFLAKITNPIIMSHYTKILSRELDVTEESINQALKQAQKKEKTRNLPFIPANNIPAKKDNIEEYLLSLIVQSPEPKDAMTMLAEIVSADDFAILPVKKIMEQLINYFQKHDKLESAEFSRSLSQEILPTFDKAYLRDVEKSITKADVLKREITIGGRTLKKISLRRKLSEISTKIRVLDKEDKDSETALLNEEMKNILNQIGLLSKPI